MQEAYAAALQGWTAEAIPTNPAAWPATVAQRRAIDTVRRNQAFRAKRLVCGVTTPDIGGPFHLRADHAGSDHRAKKKIVGSRIAFRMPPASELPDRL